MAKIKPKALLLQSKKKKGSNRISLTTIILSSLILVLTLFFLYATYRHWSRRSTMQMKSKASVFEGDNSFVNMKKSTIPGFAILDTAKGRITVELFKDSSPEVVDQFIGLCQKGYFKGMLFHRVIKHYVIQAGDINSLGAADGWTSKGKHPSLKHEAFMLGTSKEKHDNRGFELFITTAPIPDLNEKLIVFGRVVKGEDIVQVIDYKLAVNMLYQLIKFFKILDPGGAIIIKEIEEVDTDEHYQPKSPIAIVDVTLKQKI